MSDGEFLDGTFDEGQQQQYEQLRQKYEDWQEHMESDLDPRAEQRKQELRSAIKVEEGRELLKNAHIGVLDCLPEDSTDAGFRIGPLGLGVSYDKPSGEATLWVQSDDAGVSLWTHKHGAQDYGDVTEVAFITSRSSPTTRVLYAVRDPQTGDFTGKVHDISLKTLAKAGSRADSRIMLSCYKDMLALLQEDASLPITA